MLQSTPEDCPKSFRADEYKVNRKSVDFLNTNEKETEMETREHNSHATHTTHTHTSNICHNIDIDQNGLIDTIQNVMGKDNHLPIFLLPGK